jgi:hypothetical protein
MPPKGVRIISSVKVLLPAMAWDIATRSLPVEKARSPAPVTIALAA